MEALDREPAVEPARTESAATATSAAVSPAESASDPATVQYGPSGRRLYTWDELPPEARLRAEYEGKWVAWSADRTSILASAESLADLDRAVQQAGISGAIYDWIDPPVLLVTRL